MKLLLSIAATSNATAQSSPWVTVVVPLGVALLGIVGIIFTQWRADRRQDKANAETFEHQRRVAISAQQRDAAAHLIASVWELARISVEVLPHNEGNWTDLDSDEVLRLEEAQARMYVLADSRLEKATVTLVESLRTFVGNRNQTNWDNIAVGQFIEVLNQNEPLISRQ